MRVIGISASPKRGGNTEALLDRALAGASSKGAVAEKIIINDLRFKPCQECGGCQATGICVIRDDMQAVYEKLSNADVVIVASPIFFGSVTAQLKAMIDRYQCSWVAKYVLKRRPPAARKRRGAFLCASGSRKKEFFENAREIVKIFFATLDIEYARELFCPGVEGKAEILANKKALDEAYVLGRELVETSSQHAL